MAWSLQVSRSLSTQERSWKHTCRKITSSRRSTSTVKHGTLTSESAWTNTWTKSLTKSFKIASKQHQHVLNIFRTYRKHGRNSIAMIVSYESRSKWLKTTTLRKREREKERKRGREEERKREREKERKREREKERKRERASERVRCQYGNSRKQVEFLSSVLPVLWMCSICLVYAKFNGLSCYGPRLSLLGEPYRFTVFCAHLWQLFLSFSLSFFLSFFSLSLSLSLSLTLLFLWQISFEQCHMFEGLFSDNLSDNLAITICCTRSPGQAIEPFS